MKLRISELMEVYGEDAPSLPDGPGADPERVLARTREKLAARPARRKRWSGVRRALAVAAVLAALSLSAAAAYRLGAGAVLVRFFSEQGGRSLRGEEVALLDELGAAGLPAVTSGGVTITPLAAVSDGHALYLYLRVQPPEDRALPEAGEAYEPGFREFSLERAPDPERAAWGMSVEYRLAPDPFPGGNTLELVAICHAAGALDFSSGTVRSLTLQDLDIRGSGGEALLSLPGEWTFDLSGCYESRELELDAAGLSLVDAQTQITVTLERLTFSPLGLTYSVSYAPDADGRWPAPEFQVVLKDGTAAAVDQTGPGTVSPTHREASVFFSVPILAEDVDHIRFGAHRIELPR